MALEFMCGFDYLDTTTVTTHWSANTGSVVTSTVRNGTRSWRTLGATESITKTGLSNAVTRVLGFGYNFSALGAETRAIACLSDGTPSTAGNVQMALVRNPTGNLYVVRNVAPGGVPGAALQTSSLTLSANTWYFIEIVLTVDNTTGTVEVFVDGSKVGWIDFTGDTQQTANAYTNGFGFGSSASSTSQFFDDVYTKSDGTRYGPGAARAYLPDANGTVRDWTRSTGSDDYALLDEVPPNGDTDYISSTSPGNVTTLNYPALSISNNIKALQVLNYAKTTATGTIRGCARISGTNYLTGSVVLSGSYGYKPAIWETSPATSSAWTESEVDASEFGVEHQA